MASNWRTEPLTSEHQLGHLDSGRPEIDGWLVKHSVRLQQGRNCMTHVWVDDQAPYVYAFYSLTPHRLEPDEETRISGHSGGALSGYLIAKLGINRKAAEEGTTVTMDSDGSRLLVPYPVLLLISAVVDAELAADHGGGRYAFIDASNEPPAVIEAIKGVGFAPIKPDGTSLHFLKLTPPEQTT